LKELCKASKLKVSGTKQQLCERLMTTTAATDNETETETGDNADDDDETTSSARMYSGYKQYHLKEILKEKNYLFNPERSTNKSYDFYSF
jgi:hypothetical protein